MKSFSLFLLLYLAAAAAISAQDQQPGVGPIATNSSPPEPTAYAVVDRSANTRTWHRTNYDISPTGQTIPHVHRYVEMASGLHFRRDSQGPWLESSDQIQLLPGNLGAAATNGPCQVLLPSDIYTGVIDLTGADGTSHLRTRPLGISLFDGTNSVLLASLTNSVGQILPSGRDVIWTNAFAGEEGLRADIIASYRKSGFSCDLVIRKWPAGLSPGDFGLGSQCRLQLLTEVFDSPTPVATAPRTNRTDQLVDVRLDFGAIRLGRGRAFQLGTASQQSQGQPSRPTNAIPVSKSYQVLEGRGFLIEEVPLWRVQHQLDELAMIERHSGSLIASSGKGTPRASV